jgi:hypothetical protein
VVSDFIHNFVRVLFMPHNRSMAGKIKHIN